MASQYDIQSGGTMEDNITRHSDYHPDPPLIGQGDADFAKALNPTETCDAAPDGTEARIGPDYPASSSHQQRGVAFSVPAQSSTEPDTVVKQREEEFVHVKDSQYPPRGPEDLRLEEHIGDQFRGGNINYDPRSASRGGVNSGRGSPDRSGPPPLPSKPTSVIEQQQEAPSGPHTSETTQLENHGFKRHELYIDLESIQNEPERSDLLPPLSKHDPVSEQRDKYKHPLAMYSDGYPSDKGADPAPQYGSPTVPSNGRTILTGREFTHPPEQPKVVSDGYATNIVFFGETGVGKSSVINLIAGRELAHTSNDAHGCTFHHERHHIRLGNTSCALWDTTGLDEGSKGTIPARLAENNLRELMRGLAHSGGIHLVVYCIRGTRLTQALKRNYDLFYVTVCRKKVPVALVITGLEHQEGDMETWWIQNNEVLRRNGMRFDAHACVTTVDVEDVVVRQRRSESQALLRELVVDYSRLPGWKTDPLSVSRVFPSFHSVLRGMGNLGITETIRKVAVCGTFSTFLPGTTAIWDRSTGRIGNRRYEFLRVNKHTLHAPLPQPLAHIRGMGMLLFYTSTLVDNCITPTDIDALKTFYDVAGGQSCPVIVVLQDCNDERIALACRNAITSRHSDIQAHFVSIPSMTRSNPGAKLDEMIESLCVEQAEVKPQNFLRRIFG